MSIVPDPRREVPGPAPSPAPRARPLPPSARFAPCDARVIRMRAPGGPAVQRCGRRARYLVGEGSGRPGVNVCVAHLRQTGAPSPPDAPAA